MTIKKKQYLNATIVLACSFIALSAFINISNPDNYSGQVVPAYIVKDNTPPTNSINNKGATLGRVLFYDKQISANNTIACASCHLQKFAFSDTAALSKGHLGGSTDRHSMRLVNARFGGEQKFFWNERATSLEDQSTRPIKDAVEMGWSGTNGQGSIDSLVKKIRKISYYKILFPIVFGDTVITETRIQLVLSQFIRSIQSFDSRFDQGLTQTNNLAANFPNFSTLENQGKALYLAPPPNGGAGCQGCHSAPEFDIDPNTLNNGVIAVAGSSTAIDLFNTRAPSLRNLFNVAGQLNGPLMHNAQFKTIEAVINHYNNVPQLAANTNLDPRLKGAGSQLNLTQTQKDALAAFLKTLSGTAVYTDPKLSDPFEGNGLLQLITGLKETKNNASHLSLSPNPVSDKLMVKLDADNYLVQIYDGQGRLVLERHANATFEVETKEWSQGIYYLKYSNLNSGQEGLSKFIRQ